MTRSTFLGDGDGPKVRICAPVVCVATKTRCNSQVRKDSILKNLFPPVLLHICVSVCELKQSQPEEGKNRFLDGELVVISWFPLKRRKGVVCLFEEAGDGV